MHHCKDIACCFRGTETARERLHDLIMEVFITRLPPIPALNRWTKLYPAIAWWTVGLHMSGLLKHVWGHLHGFTIENADAQQEVLVDLLVPEDDEVQRRMHAARALKTWNWIRHWATPVEAMMCCIVLRPCMSFMGFLFRSEANAAPHSATVLLKPQNPVNRLIDFLLRMLNDLDNTFWQLMAYPDGWSEFKLQLAVDAMLRMVGSLWWRLVYRLARWPWLLYRIVDRGTPGVERATLRTAMFRDCDGCLDKLTAKIAGLPGAEDNLSDLDSPLSTSVRKAFEKCRATNIISETRFARITRREGPG